MRNPLPFKITTKISTADLDQIKSAVARAEKTTSGEIVPLIVSTSGSYFWVHAVFALKLLVLATIVFEVIVYMSGFPGTLPELIGVQVSAALLGWGLGYFPPAARWGVGKFNLQKNVDDQALAAFIREGLTKTRDRTGVLIYISLFEHRVEILGDSGIHQHVSNDFWQNLCDQLAMKIREGKLVEGLENTIHEVGQTLKRYFPRQSDDQNEISDDLRQK
jgi:putative membrane protein